MTRENVREKNPLRFILSRISDEEHRKRARNVLEQILPILLHDGLYNKNEDIAKFSLTTISKFNENRN